MTTIRLYQFLEGFDISGAVYNFVTKIDDAINSVKETLVTWTQRSSNRRQLIQLSDRLLEDIGITRFDVEVESGVSIHRKGDCYYCRGGILCRSMALEKTFR